MTDTHNNRDTARDVFWRLHEVYHRGHREWMQHVRTLEDMYLGGGRMWRPEHRAIVEADGRPAREVNTILPTINAAAGYQISNRVDISYLPRGNGADEEKAKLLSKVVKADLDAAEYRYVETDVFLDGLIQQRGYFDVRVSFDRSTQGELSLEALDPMDVIPDPDAKSYHPRHWSDVQVLRWLTEREIEGQYGQAAARAVVEASRGYCDLNWGEEDVSREGFGMPQSYAAGWGWYEDNAKTRRFRIVDQQSHEYAMSLCAVFPTGEVRSIEGSDPQKIAWLIDQGVHVMKRRIRRVRHRVCAPEVCFHDQLSPYDEFTVIPFFPYFRRGRTIGMVDNMVSPSEMLNKFVSQYEHVVNSSANSGWQGEEDAIANMTDEEFTAKGAQTGLVLLRKAGKQPFQKIEPNQVPTGIDKMITWTHDHLNMVSGVDKNLREPDRNDLSGVAVKALQHASQQKLAIVLDNLARTRLMLSRHVINLEQQFLSFERLVRITEIDSYGVEHQVPLPLNVKMQDGEVLNDVTIGTYDVVINERPLNVTFDSSEFEQMKAMRKDMGIAIPDATVVRASALADKSEIAQALQEQAGQTDPRIEAEAALLEAQKRKTDNEAVAKAIEAQYSALQTAQAIVVTPQAAALADALLRSGGFIDQDAAPIIPEAPAGLALPPPDAAPGEIPPHSNPLTPANPGVGITRGLSDGPANPPPSE